MFETQNILLSIITAYNFLGELLTLLIDSNEVSRAQLGLIYVIERIIIIIGVYNYCPIICEYLDGLRHRYTIYRSCMERSSVVFHVILKFDRSRINDACKRYN